MIPTCSYCGSHNVYEAMYDTSTVVTYTCVNCGAHMTPTWVIQLYERQPRTSKDKEQG
jgi:DNA-directed RNA polymerase subunit RPC12/RpoP